MSDFDFRLPRGTDSLDGIVSTVKDANNNDCYTITLQTQPNFLNADGEEIENPYNGFTAIKKYRLNLPHFNPSTQKSFSSKDEVITYAMSLPENYFSPWFDDPVEESE